MHGHMFSVNPELVTQRGRPLSEILNSLSHLRHTAVHRIRVTADRVYQFICDAENLSVILEDCESSERLADLRRGLESTIGDINRNKDLLESSHVEKLKHLAKERAKLLRYEKAAHEHLLAEDKKYQAKVTAILESNWKSANAVVGDNLEELDSNAGDGLS
jgi:Zn-dependent oligopeptidase